MSYLNPYKFVNIKPDSSPKEVKRKIKDINFHYYPSNIKIEDKFTEEKNARFKSFILSLNKIDFDLRKNRYDLKKIGLDYSGKNIRYDKATYESYLDEFRKIVYDYSIEELKIILKANNLETSESISKLIYDVIENIPCEIAKINLWEFNERKNLIKYKFDKISLELTKDICKNLHLKRSGKKDVLITRIILEVSPEEIDSLISDVLEKDKIKQKLIVLQEYKLKRILQLKSNNTKGKKNKIIDKITKYYNAEEIDSIIEKVNEEYETYKNELKKFNLEQLKSILKNENLEISGNQNQLIEEIFENISLNHLDEEINSLNKIKEKTIKKLFEIIGEDELKKEFKEYLKEYGINESQFNTIKIELVNDINNFKISEQIVEEELDKLLEKQSKENEIEALNALYEIVGKDELKPNFIYKLKNLDFDKSIGEQIKKEIEDGIKAKTILLDDIIDVINLKIKQKEIKEKNDKLTILYNYIGEDEINEHFKLVLDENNLNHDFWLKLKNEMINLINNNSIKKNSIETKINELIDLEIVNNLLLENELSTLNQIAILKGFEVADNKENQISIIKSNLSEKFNYAAINDYINKVNEVKTSLNNLLKSQIIDILEINDLKTSGSKEKLINKLFSNINLNLIISLLERHNKVKNRLKESPLNYIFFISNENNLKVKGAKTKVINEIIKNVKLEKIEKDFSFIDGIKLELNQLHYNELLYIAEINHLSISNENPLNEQILHNIDLYYFNSIFKEIEQIKELVYEFNAIQRKHLLMLSNQKFSKSDEEQINLILSNVNLKDILNLSEKIKNVEKELNSLNVDQLNYILEKNNKEPIDSKDKQIDYILTNFLIEDTERNISIIKEIQIQLDQLNDNQLNQILEMNNKNVSNNRKDNLIKIFNEIPIGTILNHITYVKNLDTKENLLEEIKDSILYTPIKKSKRKTSLTTIRKNNLNLIPVFENQINLIDFMHKFYQTVNIDHINKNINYYKKLILNESRIDGLIIFRNHNQRIIKKEELNSIFI